MHLSSIHFCLTVCLSILIVLPLHPSILPNLHSSFHKHSSLLLGLVKHPYCDSNRPWPTPKKKQNGVWKFIMSANIRDSIGFLTFFSENLHRCFLIPQESCCWFISILLLLQPSCCLLWCHCRARANKPSRYLSLGFATYLSFLCGCVPPGGHTVPTGNG